MISPVIQLRRLAGKDEITAIVPALIATGASSGAEGVNGPANRCCGQPGRWALSGRPAWSASATPSGWRNSAQPMVEVFRLWWRL